MNENPSIVIPKIDVIKIIDEEYFYALKKDFHSYIYIENPQLFEDFMDNPKPNLTEDTINLHKYEYVVSEEVEAVDKNGVSGIDSGDVISIERMKDKELDFFTDYLIPGIEKGKKAYLLGLKKSMINADKFKTEILLDFLSKKKLEIQTVINKASKIEAFKKHAFNTELEKILYEILCEINSYDQIYFPAEKIHLNLSKVQVLFLFHALTTRNIIKGLSSAELYMLVEKNFTYGKDNLPISEAYKSMAEYLPSEKQSKARKTIGKKTFNELEIKFNTLFDFLGN